MQISDSLSLNLPNPNLDSNTPTQSTQDIDSVQVNQFESIIQNQSQPKTNQNLQDLSEQNSISSLIKDLSSKVASDPAVHDKKLTKKQDNQPKLQDQSANLHLNPAQQHNQTLDKVGDSQELSLKTRAQNSTLGSAHGLNSLEQSSLQPTTNFDVKNSIAHNFNQGQFLGTQSEQILANQLEQGLNQQAEKGLLHKKQDHLESQNNKNNVLESELPNNQQHLTNPQQISGSQQRFTSNASLNNQDPNINQIFSQAQQIVDRILISDPKATNQTVTLSFNDHSAIANTNITLRRDLDGLLSIVISTSNPKSFNLLIDTQEQIIQAIQKHEKQEVRFIINKDDEHQNLQES